MATMRSGALRGWGLLGAVAVLVWASGPRAGAQTAAEEMYQRAQARAAALSDTTATAEALRGAARAYETIALAHPKSGYSDNALWEAANLMSRAFNKSGDATDRQKAIKLLQWLSSEYPNSPLVKQAEAGAETLKLAQATAPVAPAPTTVVPGTASPATPDAPARVKSISRSDLPRGDRITIELSQEVPYTHGRVADPDRLYFDFTNAAAASSMADQLRAINSPLVKSVRVGRPAAGVTRVVLDLDGHPKFSAFPLYSPFRVVVDVESTASAAPFTTAPGTTVGGSAAPASASGPPSASVVAKPALSEAPAAAGTQPVTTPANPPVAAPPTTSAPPPVTIPVSNPPPPVKDATRAGPVPATPAILGRGEYSIARQLGLGVSRVVIDAGHGGHDPGAQANGLSEADLVLDIALRLERLLQQQPGVDVVLTRRTDEFIALEERTAIANRAGPADLFLSIHANSARNSSLRGIETYFLNFATTPDAEAVAARENATSFKTMGTLPALLNAIALNNKLDESRELATMLQGSMVRRLTAQNKNTRDLGVKQAPFVVLIGAQMPSVLSEISFLSNKGEASLLKQSAYRQHIAQALCDAIVKYQGSLKKITSTKR
jgi:N-acetylmuramoyl-L-alanine amidase